MSAWIAWLAGAFGAGTVGFLGGVLVAAARQASRDVEDLADANQARLVAGAVVRANQRLATLPWTERGHLGMVLHRQLVHTVEDLAADLDPKQLGLAGGQAPPTGEAGR